jgi:hypothetical protein
METNFTELRPTWEDQLGVILMELTRKKLSLNILET